MLFRTPQELRVDPDESNWRVLLLDAAALIEERGHCKHMSSDQFGHFCVHGALAFLAKTTHDYNEAMHAMNDYLGFPLHYGATTGVIRWNDNRWTTPEQIISAMRSAAAREV
jgi:hypothetical protein